jgi:probable HAF family extracellular repeat protein
MFTNSKSLRVALVALLAAALLAGGLALAKKPDNPGKPEPPPPPPPVTYEITWLGTLGGLQSDLMDMNDLGDVVGWSYTTEGDQHAFLNEAQPDGSRVMIDLHTLLCTTFADDLADITTPRFAGGNAINNQGQVVGVMRFNNGDERRLYRYAPGPEPSLELFPLEMIFARDINNAGTFVGMKIGGAYRYTDHLEDLNGLIDPASGWYLEDAIAINDDGVIVGEGFLDGGEQRCFLFIPAAQGQTYATVVDLGPETTYVYDISEVAHVVGALEVPNNRHAFLYTLLDGLMDLGAFDRKSRSYGLGVNDLGQVVGYSFKWKARGSLFLALPPTYELLNVDDLLDPVANDPVALERWYASNVFDPSCETTISNPLPGEGFGQIGSTSTLDSIQEAYILTPVPPEE